MTEFLTLDDGTLAYEVTGDGPLVVLAHGMGDDRTAYRHLVPQLVDTGYRVAAVDLRGCGESSAAWPAYSRTAIAGDLLALVRHLGGPAVLVGHSISGGAVTIAAAQAPELVTALVELAPFTRKQAISLKDLRSARFRRGMRHLLGAGMLGRIDSWRKYLDVAYPGAKPADWTERLDHVEAKLREPGRMAALKKMGTTPATDAGAALPGVRCPMLVVQGSLDPDWAAPQAEGEAIVAELPAGLGRLAVIEGTGHYPHHQVPDEVAAVVLPFLATVDA
ncbi:alpha/beta hydrolase [Klenkia sp. LSe6-5]|uniref:Alpha/beta hydrolase n=1 Tax=Klenkia sesuvii TaxID=3103137 RepID=A0ABU8DZC5_9ACTN